MTATHLGFDQWAVSVPGHLMKVPVTATSAEEAIAKAKKGEWNKEVPHAKQVQAVLASPAPPQSQES